MKVVLFDLDGTVLRTDGAGRRAMDHALTAVFGAAGDPAYRYDGKTDRQITREQMRWAGVDDDVIDARMDDLLALYTERLAYELAAAPEQTVLLQGIPALLDQLGGRREVTLGILTGNIVAGARAKLEAVKLGIEQFRVQATGSDHEHRPMLPAVARARASALLGRDVAGEQLVIIGDTPADIHCGRALNVRAIGVATGRYTVPELAAHEPAAVFETLADTERVVEAILG
jgi:phosphoglycolate phosphatase